ncbi:MAG: Gldg family protein [Candidatus Sumerlaeota bacterium]|nr:Gldg family protein [Candidatus Sumerlaeota bacterium]
MNSGGAKLQPKSSAGAVKSLTRSTPPKRLRRLDHSFSDGAWIAVSGVGMMFVANIVAAVTGGFSLPTLAIGAVGLLLFLSILLTGEAGNVGGYVRFFLNMVFITGACALLYLIITNHNLRRDLTRNKMFSLSPQTIQYLRTIREPITVTGFTTAPQEMQRFFEQYSVYTDKLKVSIRNPFADFREAQRLKNEFETDLAPGDIFIQTGNKRKKIRDLDESVFVNALVEVRRRKDVVVYFISGHGEGSLEEPTKEQLKKNVPTFHTLKRVCEERGIKVKEAELMRTGVVPEDATVLVCAGPRLDIYPLERDAIASWLEGGGRLILMLDPPSKSDRNFPNIKSLMAQFGILLKDDLILDPNKESMKRFDMPVVPLVTSYAKHPITDNIPYGQIPLFVPIARTVNPEPNLPAGISVTPLLKSSPYSWSQSVQAILEDKFTPPMQVEIGPQSLAAVVTKTPPGGDEEKETRIVAFGDSDIFTDVNIVYQIPLFLFLNSVTWMTRMADVVAIPPKVVEDTPLSLTAGQRDFLAIFLVVTIPSLIFFGGLGYTLIRRRMR